MDTLNVVLKKGTSDKFICVSGCGVYADIYTLDGNGLLDFIKDNDDKWYDKITPLIDVENPDPVEIKTVMEKNGYRVGDFVCDTLFHNLINSCIYKDDIEDFGDFVCVNDTDGSFWLLFAPEMYDSYGSKMPSVNGVIDFFDKIFNDGHLTKHKNSINHTFGYYNIISFLE